MLTLQSTGAVTSAIRMPKDGQRHDTFYLQRPRGSPQRLPGPPHLPVHRGLLVHLGRHHLLLRDVLLDPQLLELVVIAPDRRCTGICSRRRRRRRTWSRHRARGAPACAAAAARDRRAWPACRRGASGNRPRRAIARSARPRVDRSPRSRPAPSRGPAPAIEQRSHVVSAIVIPMVPGSPFPPNLALEPFSHRLIAHMAYRRTAHRRNCGGSQSSSTRPRRSCQSLINSSG